MDRSHSAVVVVVVGISVGVTLGNIIGQIVCASVQRLASVQGQGASCLVRVWFASFVSTMFGLLVAAYRTAAIGTSTTLLKCAGFMQSSSLRSDRLQGGSDHRSSQSFTLALTETLTEISV